MTDTLIIPVENQVRELDAKLLVACVAAERGLRVVFGSKTYLYFAMPYLPRGIFFAKSMRSTGRRMVSIIRGLGHEIVAWDEESLVRFTSPEYAAWRYAEETFRAIDLLFAWGDDDAAFFKSYHGNAGVPVHATGNPRIDLLRPELRRYFDPEVARLKARYGDFILVNTNFSLVNNFVPSLNLIDRDRVSNTGLGMSLPFAKGMADHQQAIFDHFRDLLPRLAAWFPARRIVLRPHPSENHEVWRRILADCPGVDVVHEGNVVPWLMAARVLLHNGCMTAVEASVLETPAVSYMPVTSEVYDYHLPNGVSHGVATQEAVRERLSQVLGGEIGMVDAQVRQRYFDRHLAATQGPLACDRVLDVLLNGDYARRRSKTPSAAARLEAWLRCNVRTLKNQVRSFQSNHRSSAAHHAHRFPGTSVAELNERIARFGALLGRFGNVRAVARSRHVYDIVDPDAMRRPDQTAFAVSNRRASAAASACQSGS